MDYVGAKALGPLIHEITPEVLLQKVFILVIDLGVLAEAPRWVWEEAIQKATLGYIKIYTDGCKDAGGMVGGA